jgi:signal transduction histidine kinase
VPLLARLALVALALAGVAVEVVSVMAGTAAGIALLDLAAGWMLLAAAVGADSLRRGCRVQVAVAAALWFAGTLGTAGGDVGRAADLWASLYGAPLAGACLAAPYAWPGRAVERVAVVWGWVRGAIPAFASAGGATLATGIVLSAIGFGRAERDPRAVTGHRAAGAFGASLALAALLRLAGDDSQLATIVVSLGVATAGGLLLAGARRRLSPGGMTRLIVDLGRLHDARSLERRLGDALGDAQLQLRYRLRAGGGWLDSAGRSVPPPSSASRELTAIEAGGVGAALLHEAGVLDDPQLRAAVLEAVRLAIVRLGLAADAVAQADALAASRRRLVTAAERERERFEAEVSTGPGALLADAATALGGAAQVAPAELAPMLAAAADELAATRDELVVAVAGGLDERLGTVGLDGALTDLARRAGATADVRIGAQVAPEVAAGAWFCASEALANALKHAGPARIALSAQTRGDRLALAVDDDGPGGADAAGGGLAGLRSRVEALGGELTIESPPGAGTRIAVSLPLGRA